jgi:hypothetical protein
MDIIFKIRNTLLEEEAEGWKKRRYYANETSEKGYISQRIMPS